MTLRRSILILIILASALSAVWILVIKPRTEKGKIGALVRELESFHVSKCEVKWGISKPRTMAVLDRDEAMQIIESLKAAEPWSLYWTMTVGPLYAGEMIFTGENGKSYSIRFTVDNIVYDETQYHLGHGWFERFVDHK